MKQVVEVLAVNREEKDIPGKGRLEFVTAECVLHTEGQGVHVGRWAVNKDLRATLKPGRYQPDLALRIDFDGKVDAVIVALLPLNVAPRP